MESLPLSKKDIINMNSPCIKKRVKKLRAGDIVTLNGIILTGRDAFHKFVYDTYIKKEKFDENYYKLKKLMQNAFLYHCGPVIKNENREYKFIAGGPTTSIREEPYEAEVIKHFGLCGVIGKGGMGNKTKKALKKHSAVYLHAVGGAASLIAQKVESIKEHYFLKEFGIPEAVWVLQVSDFLCTVTMDAKGNSLHEKIKEKSAKNYDKIISKL
jgi:fumarate hydratase class I